MLIFVVIITLLPSTFYNFGSAKQNQTPPQENSAPKSDPLQILFIGNSYCVFNNLPLRVHEIAEASGQEDFRIDAEIINGLQLSHHSLRNETQAKIQEKDWDYIILQSSSMYIGYPEEFLGRSLYQEMLTINQQIKANCATTKVIYFMPWAYEDGMTWYDGMNDTSPEMQEKIGENALAFADTIGMLVAPVGWAWGDVLEIKNYPLHYLHAVDMSHPSRKGSWLAAFVIYTTIFQEKGQIDPSLGDLSSDEAQLFTDIASTNVLENLALLNLVPDFEREYDNHNQENAIFLTYRDYLNIAYYDEDWYKCFPIGKGDKVSIFLNNSNGENELGVEIYDMHGDPISFSERTESSGKNFTFTAKIDYSAFYIQVSNGDEGQYYDLCVDLVMYAGDDSIPGFNSIFMIFSSTICILGIVFHRKLEN
jgi:hypothetical protein